MVFQVKRLDFFKSFLANRKQRCRVIDYVSDVKEVRCDVMWPYVRNSKSSKIAQLE